ncbi:MAG: type IV pilus assembly protein PilM [Planctomycetes bacterium]|nr:type IV pilus assembly protein PilM [Planctomycetota bacterium]
MAKIKGKSLIGLDIGSKCVKAVELVSGEGVYTITGYAVEDIPAGADLKEFLKSLFQKAGFSSKKVVTAVSGRPVIVRYITMPEMSDEELPNAIKYEASKYIPFEANEVVLDCQRMDLPAPASAEAPPADSANKEMKVVLVASKRTLIEDHLAILEGAGLWPYIIDIDTFALGNAYELHQMLAANQGKVEDNKTIALIDIGTIKSSLNIMSGPVSCFTREITIAGNDFTEAISKRTGLQSAQADELKCNPADKIEDIKDATASLVDDLIHEVHLSFDYFEHQFEKPIDMVYLSGGSGRLVGLEDAFEKNLEKRPIWWNPLEYLAVDEEKLTKEDIGRHASRLAIAIGLASRVKPK